MTKKEAAAWVRKQIQPRGCYCKELDWRFSHPPEKPCKACKDNAKTTLALKTLVSPAPKRPVAKEGVTKAVVGYLGAVRLFMEEGSAYSDMRLTEAEHTLQKELKKL